MAGGTQCYTPAQRACDSSIGLAARGTEHLLPAWRRERSRNPTLSLLWRSSLTCRGDAGSVFSRQLEQASLGPKGSQMSPALRVLPAHALSPHAGLGGTRSGVKRVTFRQRDTPLHRFVPVSARSPGCPAGDVVCSIPERRFWGRDEAKASEPWDKAALLCPAAAAVHAARWEARPWGCPRAVAPVHQTPRPAPRPYGGGWGGAGSGAAGRPGDC